LDIPINPSQPLNVWNGKKFEDDASVKMRAYDPSLDVDVAVIKRDILGKLETLKSVKDFAAGETVFGSLKEHIEHSRPTMSIHYEALMDGIIDAMFPMLETDEVAIKKTVYKFLGLFIYYFKELKDVNMKRHIRVWCKEIFLKCLRSINADVLAVDLDMSLNPQVLVNAILVLRNSMEFIDDLNSENVKYLVPILLACIKGMGSSSPLLSQTDKEIFLGPVYIGTMFNKLNRYIARSDVYFITLRLLDDKLTSSTFRIKLTRLIVSLAGAQKTMPLQIEPLVRALESSKNGEDVADDAGEFRWVLWHACYLVKCLAANDSHKEDLIKRGVIETCREIISTNYMGDDHYLRPNEKNRIQAFEILTHLSFCSSLLSDLSANEGFQQWLDTFKNDKNLGIYVEEIRWNLTMLRRDIRKCSRYPGGPILLLFAEGDEEIQKEILHFLDEKSQYKCILNKFRNISEMTSSITKASVVIMGLSSNYSKSAKARIETEYAVARGKATIALNLISPHYRSMMNGWLYKYTRFALDMTTRDGVSMDRLLSGIAKHIDGMSDAYHDLERSNAEEAPSPISRISEITTSYAANGTTVTMSTIDDIYSWLRDVVRLEGVYINSFRRNRMTIQSFFHLGFLAINSFLEFHKTLNMSELQFPTGVVLHLAHFFKRDFHAFPAFTNTAISHGEERKEVNQLF